MAELDCPTSLYGMALAEPLQLNRKKDGCFIFFFEHVRIWGLLFMNYSIQLLFVFELWQMEVPAEEHAYVEPIACDQKVALLEFVCIFVFEVAMFNEVRDSVGIFRLLWNADPPAPEQEETAKKTGWIKSTFSTTTEKNDGRRQTAQGAILTEVKDVPEEKNSWMNRLRRKVPTHPSGPRPWSLNGIGCMYKLLMLFIVALPKLVLGILLAYIGGWYIMDSKDKETLILNTLAVTFIMDINQFLYSAFTSPSIQESLENMEPVFVDIKNTDQVMHWFLNAIVYPVLVVVLSGALTMKFKFAACHNYDPKDDVETTFFGSLSAFFSNLHLGH